MKENFYNELMDSLRQVIANKHSGLLATINTELLVTFWNIGNELNQFEQDTSNGLVVQTNAINNIARDFVPIFGDYFAVHNLLLMKKFAEKYSLNTIIKRAAAVNWEYIPCLLDIQDDEAYSFYVELIHNKSLSPNDLNKIILSGASRIEPNKNFFLQSYSNPFYQNTIQLYFGRKHGQAFRKFFEPKERSGITLESFLAKSNGSKTIYQAIFELILDCQSNAQHMLNLEFNTLLWDIGNEILAYKGTSNIPATTDLIARCIKEIQKDCPSIFNDSELPYCIKFAQSYKNPDKQYAISETVSWDYIKIILEINDVKKQAFIANEVLINDIAIQDLKELILNGCFDFMMESNASIKFPMEKTSITKERRESNVVIEITEETVEQKINPKSDINRNVFQNKTLLQFLEGNYKQ